MFAISLLFPIIFVFTSNCVSQKSTKFRGVLMWLDIITRIFKRCAIKKGTDRKVESILNKYILEVIFIYDLSLKKTKVRMTE